MNPHIKHFLKTLLTVVILIAAALVALKLWNNEKAKKAAAEAAADNRTVVEATELSAITYNNGDAVLSFHRNEQDVWVWDENEEYPLNTDYLEELSSAITGLKTTATISTEEDETLETYGLDSPSAQIDATALDGTVTSIQLGNQTDAGTYYMKFTDKDEVYVITSALHKSISHGIYDMYLLETLPALSAENVTDLTIEGAKTTVYNVLTEGEGDSATHLWYKGSANVNADPATTAMAEELSHLAFTSCVVWNPVKKSLTLCGLKEPVMTLTVNYLDANGRSASLLLRIGNAIDEESYYCRWNDSTTIYSISAASITTLLKIAAEG